MASRTRDPESWARVRCYALLAKLFYSGPCLEDGAEWLEMLNILGSTREAWSRGDDTGVGLWSRCLARTIGALGDTPAVWDNVRHQYVRLFIGPYHVPAPPYESVYSKPQRMVMQEATIAVRRAYAEAGLAVIREGEFPDDHLACELEFAGFLLTCSLLTKTDPPNTGDPLVRTDSLACYRSFLSEHLMRWVPSLCQDIAAQRPGEFFAALAEFIPRFLRSELEVANLAHLRFGAV